MVFIWRQKNASVSEAVALLLHRYTEFFYFFNISKCRRKCKIFHKAKLNIMNMIVVSCLLSLTISYLPLLSEYVEISNLSAILEKVFSMQSLFEYSLRKHFLSMRCLHLILSVNQNHLCSTSSILFLLFYWQQSLLICQLLFLTVLKQIEVYLEPSRISFCETS